MWVCCAVRTGSLSISGSLSPTKDRAISQTVSRLCLTAEARVLSGFSQYEICGSGASFVGICRRSALRFVRRMVRTLLHLYVSFTGTKIGRSLRIFPECKTCGFLFFIRLAFNATPGKTVVCYQKDGVIHSCRFFISGRVAPKFLVSTGSITIFLSSSYKVFISFQLSMKLTW